VKYCCGDIHLTTALLQFGDSTPHFLLMVSRKYFDKICKLAHYGIESIQCCHIFWKSEGIQRWSGKIRKSKKSEKSHGIILAWKFCIFQATVDVIILIAVRKHSSWEEVLFVSCI